MTAATADAGTRHRADLPQRALRFLQRREELLVGLSGLALALVAWEALVRTGTMAPTVISSPTVVAETGWELARSGVLWDHILATTLEFVLALVLASVVGVLIGLAAGLSRHASDALGPWLGMLSVTPLPALTPVFILWFGIGIEFKIVLGFLVGIFPIAISTKIGVEVTATSLLAVARSFGASRWKVLRTVILPTVVPHAFTGIHQAGPRVLVAVVIGELLGANTGLGFMIGAASATFDIPTVMLGIVLLGIFGIAIVKGLGLLERRFSSWRPNAWA
jgi:ABC-type nitrate/sulfonate/bicarbonate transport system permease component